MNMTAPYFFWTAHALEEQLLYDLASGYKVERHKNQLTDAFAWECKNM